MSAMQIRFGDVPSPIRIRRLIQRHRLSDKILRAGWTFSPSTRGSKIFCWNNKNYEPGGDHLLFQILNRISHIYETHTPLWELFLFIILLVRQNPPNLFSAIQDLNLTPFTPVVLKFLRRCVYHAKLQPFRLSHRHRISRTPRQAHRRRTLHTLPHIRAAICDT